MHLIVFLSACFSILIQLYRLIKQRQTSIQIGISKCIFFSYQLLTQSETLLILPHCQQQGAFGKTEKSAC